MGRVIGVNHTYNTLGDVQAVLAQITLRGTSVGLEITPAERAFFFEVMQASRKREPQEKRLTAYAAQQGQTPEELEKLRFWYWLTKDVADACAISVPIDAPWRREGDTGKTPVPPEWKKAAQGYSLEFWKDTYPRFERRAIKEIQRNHCQTVIVGANHANTLAEVLHYECVQLLEVSPRSKRFAQWVREQ